MLPAVHVDLRDHRLEMVGLLDGAVHAKDSGEALERAGRLQLAGFMLPSLTSSSVVNRTGVGWRGGLRGADRAGEVASDQRARVDVIDRELGEPLVVVDPREPEQRGNKVRVVGRDLELAGAAGQQWAGDDERDAKRVVVGAVALLVHPAVGALQVAVIRAEDHDRVLICLAGLERVDTRVICSPTAACIWLADASG